jgi:predicted lipoprotein
VRRISAVLAACLLVLGAGACGGDDGGSSSSPSNGSGAALRALADDVIVPGYADLADRLDALAAAVDELCGAPGDAALESARAAWREAAVAWPATRAGGVGPAMERRLMGAIGYPARPGTVSGLLEGDGPLDPDALASEGSAARGLPTLELLLFDAGSAALAAPDPAGARRCEYAGSAATLAASAAREVLDDWTGGYVDSLASGGQDSVAALVNEVAHTMQEVDDQGLRVLANAETVDDLPSAMREGPAAHDLAELRAMHAGVAAVVLGGSGSDSGSDSGPGGLLAVVEDRDPDVAGRLRSAVTESTDAFAGLPASTAEGITAQAAALAAAGDAAARVKVVVGTEVASVLGVTIGFSDADGDS